MLYLKAGIKPDRLAALRTAPLHLTTLFADSVIKQTEEDIANYDKGHSRSMYKKGRYYLYEGSGKKSYNIKQDRTAWKNISSHGQSRRGKENINIHPDQPRASSPINDNYCVNDLQAGLVAGSKQPTPDSDNNNEHFFTKDSCKLCCCKSCTYCTRAFTKERCKSWPVRLLSELQIKICERCFLCRSIVFCKTFNKCLTCCLKSACRGQTSELLAKLAGSGCRSESSSNPQEGYTLPFRTQPNLPRSPIIITCYVNPHRNLYLLEALHQLMDKNAVELVQNQRSLGFFNRLFLVPKLNNKW